MASLFRIVFRNSHCDRRFDGNLVLNPYTGKVLRKAPSRAALKTILNLHYALLAGKTGEIITGLTGLLGFILVVSGIWGRIIYFCVGLAPTILLITGFIMYCSRRRAKPQTQTSRKLVEK
jgi:uncharacterized iron-regulated membrane protein